mgnify:CR=1 FL=1
MISVLIPTWRLGVDVVLEALEKQEYRDFEVILVDGLHRWRYRKLDFSQFRFPIKHIPVEDSLMPVVCHSRYRNTAIRAARGDRMVFLADYASPPPGFLGAHAQLAPDMIGIAPYRLYPPCQGSVAYPHRHTDFWAVIEEAIRGNYLYSIFTSPGAADKSIAKDLGVTTYPFRTSPEYPLLNIMHSPIPMQLTMHWKSDSAPSAAVLAVNGWGLEYDGSGGYGDTDFALRLLRTGLQAVAINLECPIIDMHLTMQSILTNVIHDKLDTHNLALLRALEADANRTLPLHGLNS